MAAASLGATATEELAYSRAQSRAALKSRWEYIFEKYSKDSADIADEIDLNTGRIVVDNGHVRGMRDESELEDDSLVGWGGVNLTNRRPSRKRKRGEDERGGERSSSTTARTDGRSKKARTAETPRRLPPPPGAQGLACEVCSLRDELAGDNAPCPTCLKAPPKSPTALASTAGTPTAVVNGQRQMQKVTPHRESKQSLTPVSKPITALRACEVEIPLRPASPKQQPPRASAVAAAATTIAATIPPPSPQPLKAVPVSTTPAADKSGKKLHSSVKGVRTPAVAAIALGVDSDEVDELSLPAPTPTKTPSGPLLLSTPKPKISALPAARDVKHIVAEAKQLHESVPRTKTATLHPKTPGLAVAVAPAIRPSSTTKPSSREKVSPMAKPKLQSTTPSTKPPSLSSSKKPQGPALTPAALKAAPLKSKHTPIPTPTPKSPSTFQKPRQPASANRRPSFLTSTSSTPSNDSSSSAKKRKAPSTTPSRPSSSTSTPSSRAKPATSGPSTWARLPPELDPFYDPRWDDEHPDGTPDVFRAAPLNALAAEFYTPPPRRRHKGTPRAVKTVGRSPSIAVAKMKPKSPRTPVIMKTKTPKVKVTPMKKKTPKPLAPLLLKFLEEAGRGGEDGMDAKEKSGKERESESMEDTASNENSAKQTGQLTEKKVQKEGKLTEDSKDANNEQGSVSEGMTEKSDNGGGEGVSENADEAQPQETSAADGARKKQQEPARTSGTPTMTPTVAPLLCGEGGYQCKKAFCFKCLALEGEEDDSA